MFTTCQTALMLLALIPNALVQDKKQQKDPPLHFEGVVSSIDKTEPSSVALTITVKEMRPTSREDQATLVDKNYEFKVDPSAKIIGLDGKAIKDGLKSLPRGTKVRIETKPKHDKTAMEIKILPQD